MKVNNKFDYWYSQTGEVYNMGCKDTEFEAMLDFFGTFMKRASTAKAIKISFDLENFNLKSLADFILEMEKLNEIDGRIEWKGLFVSKSNADKQFELTGSLTRDEV